MQRYGRIGLAVDNGEGWARVPYQVVFIDDGGLPDEFGWVFARLSGITYLFVKQSRLSADLLTEAWIAWDTRDDSGGDGSSYSSASRELAASNA